MNDKPFALADPPQETNQQVAARILIADDNPVNRLVALRAVRHLGYEVEVAANGVEALEAIAHNRFDLVLMDCQMPEMDGYQASAEIRRLEAGIRHVPIIALAANATEGDSRKCLDAGMDDYLAKPVRLQALAQALRHWLPHLVSQ